MLLLISEASMVCVTLDVTAATTTTHPAGVYLVVASPSLSIGGESRRYGALPAVVVHVTDSHWRDSWSNIALRSVPHA